MPRPSLAKSLVDEGFPGVGKPKGSRLGGGGSLGERSAAANSGIFSGGLGFSSDSNCDTVGQTPKATSPTTTARGATLPIETAMSARHSQYE